MSWEKTTIGKHCTVTSSKRFHLSDRSNSGVPFYCSKEIIQKVKNEEIDSCDYMSEEFYQEVAQKYGVPQENDLLITTRGTIGIPYLCKKSDRFYFADGNLTWMKDFQNTLLPQYLYYWFLSYEGQRKIDAIAKGTAQKAVPIAGIKTLELQLPPIEIQRRIAYILSAYDNLIENNRKQIKLLEEAAQRLYKEWFVNLRFPGHEHTKITDGVPEGWEVGCLSKIAEFKRGKTITKAQIEPGNVPVVAGGLEPAYFHNVAISKAPVITVSGSGVNAGFTRMYHVNVFASDCSFVDKSTCAFLPFVYCFLTNHKAQLKYLQKGSAQPHVYAKDINALHICVPKENLLHQFCEFANPLFSKMGALEKQSNHLAQARDRLLPKLMSGEVEV